MSRTAPTPADALPTSPSISRPASFETESDTWVAAHPAYRSQLNTLADVTYGNAVDSYSSATASASSAADSLSYSNNSANSAADAAVSAAAALITSGGTATSNTSATLVYGSMTFAVQTGKGFVVGMSVKVASASAPTNWASGDVTAYNSATGSLSVNVTRINGSASGTSWSVSISAPAAPSDLGYIHVRDEKSSGTSGGSSIAGTQTRSFNTVVTNTMTGASLASNRVTIPAGTYRFDASAPVTINGGHQCGLMNHTDSALIMSGNSHYSFGGSTGVSRASGRFTITSAKEVRLDHWTASAVATSGLGASVGSGFGEVYSDLKIWKEA